MLILSTKWKNYHKNKNSSYQKYLKEKNVIQSMSKKGNSLDNGLMEYFFRLLKSKIFYNQENKYKSLDELKNRAKLLFHSILLKFI